MSALDGFWPAHAQSIPQECDVQTLLAVDMTLHDPCSIQSAYIVFVSTIFTRRYLKAVRMSGYGMLTRTGLVPQI